MKINKKIIQLSFLMFCLSFCFCSMNAEAASGKKKEVKKEKQQKEKIVISDYSSIFDAEYYYNTYPDLQVVFGKDNEKLFQHFVNHGMKEGRVGSAEFNVKAYMKNNLDLVALFKADDLTEYYAHFANAGKNEGRIANYQSDQILKEGMLSTHTTYYNPQEARATNVEVAASRINGVVVKPGESFSYSTTLKPRTLENGYVNGPVIKNGKFVDGLGGGICQVSSNLYVSMLLAGIEPTEHHYHSLPVEYVPEGLDAVIAKGAFDLRFTNYFTHDVIIEATAIDGVLTVSILRG